MTVLIGWLLVGVFVLLIVTNDVELTKIGLINNLWDRFVVIWAWPAVLFMFVLFPFCRDEDEEVVPKL